MGICQGLRFRPVEQLPEPSADGLIRRTVNSQTVSGLGFRVKGILLWSTLGLSSRVMFLSESI